MNNNTTTQQHNNTTTQINKAAAAQTSEVTIYWDSQDPNNTGVAYRYADGSESGACEFVNWSKDCDGMNVGDFFDGDGKYLGPDQDGVYPVFSI